MEFTPEPGVHASHRCPHYQAEMIGAEFLRDQAVLGQKHVVVAVAWETRMQPVARLARVAMSDGIGQDDEVTPGIQDLPLAEQLTREAEGEKTCARTAGSMQNQNGISGDSRCIPV